MSNMLLDLIGQRCAIKNENEEYLTGHPEILCRLLAADEDWIKIAYVNKEGNRVLRMERIETVSSVTVYEDD